MIREMRRRGQQLPRETCEELLERGSSGVLSLFDGETPYAVPLSYVYADGRLYFHSAPVGHKIDAIRTCGKASFCVIAQDDVVPAEYTTRYRSVVVFGTVRVTDDEEEKTEAITLLARKYHPTGSEEAHAAAIAAYRNAFCIIELTAERITGKASPALFR